MHFACRAVEVSFNISDSQLVFALKTSLEELGQLRAMAAIPAKFEKCLSLHPAAEYVPVLIPTTRARHETQLVYVSAARSWLLLALQLPAVRSRRRVLQVTRSAVVVAPQGVLGLLLGGTLAMAPE